MVDPRPTERAQPVVSAMEVRVTRSRRRKKTAEAKLINGILDLRIPASCSPEEEAEFVDHFRQRFERSRRAVDVDLTARARKLARDFGLPEPTSIRWVSNQNQRWGSCTPVDGTIRISDRMAGYPRFVIDYVIVHELVHLVEVNHSKRFHRLVEAFPQAERAKGYLQAKSDGL